MCLVTIENKRLWQSSRMLGRSVSIVEHSLQVRKYTYIITILVKCLENGTNCGQSELSINSILLFSAPSV
jgi:hypothetical protein